jgi:hypothetical protein
MSRATPVLVALLLLGSVALLAGHRVDSAHTEGYARDLRRLPTLDALVNADVLEARANVTADYDALGGRLAELRRLLNADAIPLYLDASARERLKGKVQRSRELLREKEALIEQFKTENSVLRNSVAFAPVEARHLARTLEDRALPRLADDVHQLIGNVVVYHQFPEFLARTRVEESRRALLADGEAAQVSPELTTLLRHVDVILSHETRANDVMAAIIALPSLAADEDVESTSADDYAQTLKALGRSRLAALACGIAGLVLMGWEIVRSFLRAALCRGLALPNEGG